MQEYELRHLEKIREGLAECTVLLKSNGDFPLDEPCPIAAYGSGIRHTVKGGTGSGEVNSRYFVTIEEGLEAAGFTVTTKDRLEEYAKIRKAAKIKFTEEIRALAKEKHTLAIMEGMGKVMPEPDYDLPLNGEGAVCVYVVSRICGEGNDRTDTPGDFRLTDTEIRDIRECRAKYAKFLLVINAGGVIDLTPVMDTENILVLSQLGVETGHVLAKLLTGEYYPSGKLASTWASYKEYCHEGTFGEEDDTRYKEGIYVGYRYFDSAGKTPLFPFGYGLGYTTFEITEETVRAEGETVIAEATIRNTGSRKGKEVFEVYVSLPEGKLDKAEKDLAAFVKTRELAPGETTCVRAEFPLSQLSSYDEETASYILEKGDYTVRTGNSAANTRAIAVLRLEKTVIVQKGKNCLGKPDFEDLRIERKAPDTDGLPVILLKPEEFPTRIVDYGNHPEISREIFSLTEEELIRYGIGNYSEKFSLGSVVGNAARSVAGAAGETTTTLRHKNIPAMVMADGPAGLRLSPLYYADKKGVHGLGQGMPETMAEYLPKILRRFVNGSGKIPKNAVVREQYTTAIPIGTAIAQSWNTEYAETCGDVVGSEMEKFGVHLWLAPALNIHRDPLCGRNFEYFSEDPLISGTMAGALTKGVQKHAGCAVTVKHFAFNNQENNRYNNNSLVSERAAREIYLRGFEICIRQAHPLALMTSYNLVNGVHTSECYGLTTDILRREFGFDGIVMTDWVVSGVNFGRRPKYPGPNAAKVAAAGGDLFMPGSKKEFREVKEGLARGTVTKYRLQENADAVYAVTKKLK